jgi:hypothetical protein
MRLFGRKPKWSIVTSAPKGDAGRRWGDYWFATDLAQALKAEGVDTKVVSRASANSQQRNGDDVVVVLRGLRRVVPSNTSATWMLWVISHPELVEPGEAAQYSRAFAASQQWDPGPEIGEFIPLLQATNSHRFTPISSCEKSGVLFVGSTRGEFRPIVRDALAAQIPLKIYGVGWDEFLAPDQIAGEFVDNSKLPAAYASSAIVLNDHHREMAEQGFLSNRLFDAVAAGARVVSDPARGISEVFGSSVVTYQTPEELAEIIRDADSFFPSEGTASQRIRSEHDFRARARALIAAADSARHD